MPFITASLLANIGIHLTSSELELFNEQYEAELDKRIVDEIIDELAPDQISELVALKNAPSGELQAWLVQERPRFRRDRGGRNRHSTRRDRRAQRLHQ